MSKKISIAIALAIILIAAVCIYRMVHVHAPEEVVVTDNELEQLKKENADMKRRIELLEKSVKQGAEEIRGAERESVDVLPPDDIAAAIVDELRLFLNNGTD